MSQIALYQLWKFVATEGDLRPANQALHSSSKRPEHQIMQPYLSPILPKHNTRFKWGTPACTWTPIQVRQTHKHKGQLHTLLMLKHTDIKRNITWDTPKELETLISLRQSGKKTVAPTKCKTYLKPHTQTPSALLQKGITFEITFFSLPLKTCHHEENNFIYIKNPQNEGS